MNEVATLQIGHSSSYLSSHVNESGGSERGSITFSEIVEKVTLAHVSEKKNRSVEERECRLDESQFNTTEEIMGRYTHSVII